MSQFPTRCLTCRSGLGTRRGNCKRCYDKHARAVRQGKASWAELERRGLAVPAESPGRKWMKGFGGWFRAGKG